MFAFCCLYGDRRLDGRPRVVAFEDEVFVAEAQDVFHVRIDAHDGKRPRLARKLQLHLLEVVRVDMRVAEGMDEVAGLEAAGLCHHHRQQRIRGDVERHAEEHVGAALVQLAREASARDVELEQRVARRQGHVVHLGGVPG